MPFPSVTTAKIRNIHIRHPIGFHIPPLFFKAHSFSFVLFGTAASGSFLNTPSMSAKRKTMAVLDDALIRTPDQENPRPSSNYRVSTNCFNLKFHSINLRVLFDYSGDYPYLCKKQLLKNRIGTCTKFQPTSKGHGRWLSMNAILKPSANIHSSTN